MSLILWLFTSILDTLESTPTVVLVSSYGKSYSSKKHRNELLFLTLKVPIKGSLTFTRASERFVLNFVVLWIIDDKRRRSEYNTDRMCGDYFCTYYVKQVLT